MGINAEELLRNIAPKNSQSPNPMLSVDMLVGRKIKSNFLSRGIYFCTFELEKTISGEIIHDEQRVALHTPLQVQLKSYLYDNYPSFDFVPKFSVNSEEARKLEGLLRQGDARVVLSYSGHY